MHIDFPNLTHTPGEHTIKFDWPDENFTGQETDFHVSLGYGEVFTNISTNNVDVWVDDRIVNPNWFGYSATNGTVGGFEATFDTGYTDYSTLNWHEAEEYAQTLMYEGVSGHLATITSVEEANLVFDILDGQAYWIGGFHNMEHPSYSEPSGGWEWVTGENFSGDYWGEGEPNEAGPEDCLEIWGFDKVFNDNRCHIDWMGLVVEYELNGTNHYEAYVPNWYWDDQNGTDILKYELAKPLTDDERNEILKEEGDPDADNDGIVDEFDEDDDNDGILDENDMDDDNDGIDDAVAAGGTAIISGNDFTSWTVNWTSPESGSTTFNLAVNSVNGDGVASADDKWNTMSVSISGPSSGVAAEPLEPADPFVVLATLIIVSGLLLGAVILYTFYRANPNGFSWEVFSPWITDWLTSTDHKKVGTLYFLAGFFFLGVGGIMAMLIRVQLAVPGNDFLTQDQYNQFFTMHGTVMIFLAAMPLINGFANWLIPLQIGAADLALPRINAMSFWLQPVGALLIFTGIFSGAAADTGWTGYAPYIVSETAHSGTTMWVAGQIMLVASSTLTGINFLTTICAMRAPTMGWMQMPLFTWSVFVANLMLFISIPAWGVGLIQVYLDRTIGTAFYHVASGGDPLLWSHLFWYFGHPEVYVVILPAFGVISEVIATSARRSVFGFR